MNPGTDHPKLVVGESLRRPLLTVLAVLAAGGGLVALSESRRPDRAAAPTIQRLITQRLDAQNLSYRYVACLPNGRKFDGRAVVRCNVNFNAPHIEVYCSVLSNGRLLTDHEEPAIPCPRDDRGKDPPVQKSS